MATKEDILEALADYQVQCNNNTRLRRMQRDWSTIPGDWTKMEH